MVQDNLIELHFKLTTCALINNMYAFQSYDDAERQKGVEKGDKKQVFKYSAESDEAVLRMDDQKQRVEQLKDKV